MMSLMSKLLSLAVVTTLTISAGTDSDDVKSYVKKHMIKNKQVKVTDVDVISSKILDKPKGWEVFFLNIHANVKKSATVYDKVTVPETLFVKDGYTVPTLIDLETGEDYKNLLKPELSKDVYNDKHLIAGNKDAKYKLVVFSDPQCPFCQTKVPEIYEAVKANPKELSLYYYHFPLLGIHPVSDIITRAMLVEQNKGNHAKAMAFYSLRINPKEVNATKVLAKINTKYKVNITEKDINTKEVSDEVRFDKDMATKSMVSGTPTLYIDGIWDPSRNKYKKLISKSK
ncbi:MAG: Secreted protein, suppressor for copper-sensitivity ScsC [uncultured Sulfurovum sp.]|uniref:Secreted protein, suppressor for copper-sensitivity ScsC n=1 Tax=uncultured Sulfurovum sp. TaxID=269237 RepID=A0A6S6SRQ9_9BACT|nr:MAG: Secreted protein, suppressor for copper-sensitivity ScsC [uncultured Sulfurovum sp.]